MHQHLSPWSAATDAISSFLFFRTQRASVPATRRLRRHIVSSKILAINERLTDILRGRTIEFVTKEEGVAIDSIHKQSVIESDAREQTVGGAIMAYLDP